MNTPKILTSTFLLGLLLTTGARADSIWNVTSGDWNTAGNWSPSGVPVSGTDVRIGTTSTNRTANITTANAVSGDAVIGYNAGNIAGLTHQT